MSPGLPYSLNCSVCQGVYFSKTEWLQHLTTIEHQIPARKEGLEKWNIKRNGIKERCLVIFSSFPLTLSSDGGDDGAAKVVRYFSRDPYTFVTDFVCWGDRPCFGILQFESKKKALEAIEGSASTKVSIDNAKVEVKWAGDMSKLEWNSILPRNDAEVSNATASTVENDNPNSNRHTSSQGSSLIHDDNVDEDNQSTEVSSSSRQELKNAVGNLKKFAQRQQWREPAFRFCSPNVSHLPKYLCSIVLNGVEYKPSARVAGSNSKKEAKLKAAMFTLDKLALSSSGNCEEEHDDVESLAAESNHSSSEKGKRAPKRALEPEEGSKEVEEDQESHKLKKKLKIDGNAIPSGNKNAISLLMQLAQLNGWPIPVFKHQKEGKDNAPLFSCSVQVNGVEYIPDVSIPKVRTLKQAKFLIAKSCLKKLFSSSTSPNSQAAEKSETITTKNLFKDLPNSSSVPDSLQYELWRVQNAVTISDAEFRMALETVNALKELFLLEDPTAEVVMFRNWHLKLRNPNYTENHELLIYVYSTRSQPDFPDSFTWFPESAVQRLLDKANGRNNFRLLEGANNSSNVDKFNQPIGYRVEFKPNNVTFRLVTYQRFFAEVQMCRLAEYMITFDSRCLPLLKLVYYWTTNNCVTIGEFNSTGKNTHWSLPEPHALEWLVIVFLCHKGIIPTPREIQERPHQLLKERLEGIDVGFHADPEFVKEWKSKRNANQSEDNYLTELELFQDFLQFCGETLNSDSWILNTRDGELINIAKFLTCAPNKKSASSWQTKMSVEETQRLRLLQSNSTSRTNTTASSTNSNQICQYKVDFKVWKLYMVNPFIFTYKISISKDMPTILDLMKSSGRQLKRYLNVRAYNDAEAAKKRYGTLEKVLKVE